MSFAAPQGTFAASPARANYPDRPVRFIIAQLPGGNADIIGRALAEGLSEYLGQPFVIDNRGGASGIIATELTVRAAADGYTLLLVGSTFGVNPAVTRKLPYDPLARSGTSDIDCYSAQFAGGGSFAADQVSERIDRSGKSQARAAHLWVFRQPRVTPSGG